MDSQLGRRRKNPLPVKKVWVDRDTKKLMKKGEEEAL